MISCKIELDFDSGLYKLLMLEDIRSERAECVIKKGKVLTLNIKAKDAVGMKALINSILNVIETYNKIK